MPPKLKKHHKICFKACDILKKWHADHINEIRTRVNKEFPHKKITLGETIRFIILTLHKDKKLKNQVTRKTVKEMIWFYRNFK